MTLTDKRERERQRKAAYRAAKRQDAAVPTVHPGGRPTKRTAEALKLILAALEVGNTRKDSALAAGMSFETFNEWRKDSAEFQWSIERAESKARQRFVGQWAVGASRDWRAAEAYLKRRDPENWRDPDGAPTVQILNVQTDPGWIAARNAMMRALAPFPDARLAVVAEFRQLPGWIEPAPPRGLAPVALAPFRPQEDEDPFGG